MLVKRWGWTKLMFVLMFVLMFGAMRIAWLIRPRRQSAHTYFILFKNLGKWDVRLTSSTRGACGVT